MSEYPDIMTSVQASKYLNIGLNSLYQLVAIGKTEEDYKPSERLAREHSTYLFNHGHGVELTGKTYWSAYNAITEYVDHVSVLRQDGKLKKTGSMSAIFGQGAMVKREALRILTRWAIGVGVAIRADE